MLACGWPVLPLLCPPQLIIKICLFPGRTEAKLVVPRLSLFLQGPHKGGGGGRGWRGRGSRWQLIYRRIRLAAGGGDGEQIAICCWATENYGLACSPSIRLVNIASDRIEGNTKGQGIQLQRCPHSGLSALQLGPFFLPSHLLISAFVSSFCIRSWSLVFHEGPFVPGNPFPLPMATLSPALVFPRAATGLETMGPFSSGFGVGCGQKGKEETGIRGSPANSQPRVFFSMAAEWMSPRSTAPPGLHLHIH